MKVRRTKAKPPSGKRLITEIKNKLAQKKRIKFYFSLAIVLVIVLFFVIGNRGTLKLISFYKQNAEIDNEIEILELQKNELDTVKTKLENDPNYIEKVAREKYKMKKKGERVYKVVEK